MRTTMRRWMLAAATGALLAVAGLAQADEWAAYGRDPGGTRFSPLTQVTPQNVANLKPAWTFHTGDIADGKAGTGPRSGFETTPLLLDGRLYLTTPFNRVIALDPATGGQLWSYDPKIERRAPYGDGLINRGLAAFRDMRPLGDGGCGLRLFEATLDARLIALDARTGSVLWSRNAASDTGRTVPDWGIASSPLVIDDLVVAAAAGWLVAYDAATGNPRWFGPKSGGGPCARPSCWMRPMA